MRTGNILACYKAILNILDKETKIVFAHKMLHKSKVNEIAALKRALSEDDLFGDEGQIFSFDAIQTQAETLNQIDRQGDFYNAKVKTNQKALQDKIIQTIEIFQEPVDRYIHEDLEPSHGKKYVKRELAFFIPRRPIK